MAVGSIVDYLKKNGQDSSYAARAQLAANYGIQGYKGTAAQNTQLLKSLQSGAQPATNPAQAQTPQTTTQTVTPNPAPGPATPTKVYQQTFQPSEVTTHYKTRMLETEDDEPGPYNSMYQDTINSILDTINNRQPFNIDNDANYQKLYTQNKERYQAQADRAMRDTMASANAATGGYGSTYGQAVAQQAYDRTMEGLNDQNMSLMNLALQIYNDETANNYKKLQAYQGQDNTMYSRYRDDVNDWQNDRAYNASQYWNSFQNDRSAYDTDRAFAYGVDKDELTRDDALYQDALSTAMNLAQNGLQVPEYLTDRINQYNKKYGLAGDAAASLAGLAAQVQALQAAKKKSSGGGGGGSSKSKKKSEEEEWPTVDREVYEVETVKNKDILDIMKYLDEHGGGQPYSNLPSSEEYLQYVKDNYNIQYFKDANEYLQPIKYELDNNPQYKSVMAQAADETIKQAKKKQKEEEKKKK